MFTKRVLLKFSTVLFIIFSFNPALAIIPPSLNYQGHLTDDAGAPVDGTVTMTFRIYDVDAGGFPLWTDIRSVTVDHGVFSVELGVVSNPFPAGLFETPLWMSLSVGADGEMIPRRPITSSGFAFKAGDADMLQGISASALDQSAHVSDMNNPHNVTALLLDAVSETDLATHAADAGAHHDKTTSFADLADTATDAQVPDNVTIDQATNADTVDGLHASGAPVVGQLLALDVGGKFPNSTLYMGPGSGLDADTVDGFHAASFSISTHSHYSLNAFDGNPLEAVFVDSIGRVGIGTTEPSEELHIAGTNPRLLVEDTGGSNPEINLRSAGKANWAIYKQSTSGDLRFFQGTSDKVLIQDVTGNVGIGTTNPGKKLDVVGDIMAQGTGGFNGAGDEAVLNLGVIPGHFYLKAVWGDGIKMGTYAAADSFVLKQTTGNVGIGTANPTTKLDVNGRVKTKTLEITGGADLSEQFNISDDVELLKPIPGMVVSIDPEKEGALVVSDHAYNRRVAGIISGAGDVNPGMVMGQQGTAADGAYPVALTGRVYCLAETSGGSIEPGDLLTTSDIPGYAMKVKDYGKAQGAIIGKAMTRLDRDKGQVLVLVTLQ
jgi:hypothetical protein